MRAGACPAPIGLAVASDPPSSTAPTFLRWQGGRWSPASFGYHLLTTPMQRGAPESPPHPKGGSIFSFFWWLCSCCDFPDCPPSVHWACVELDRSMSLRREEVWCPVPSPQAKLAQCPVLTAMFSDPPDTHPPPHTCTSAHSTHTRGLCWASASMCLSPRHRTANGPGAAQSAPLPSGPLRMLLAPQMERSTPTCQTLEGFLIPSEGHSGGPWRRPAVREAPPLLFWGLFPEQTLSGGWRPGCLVSGAAASLLPMGPWYDL